MPNHQALKDIFKNNNTWFIIILIIFSTIFYLSKLNYLPLTAYDEAVYAQVVDETIASGNIWTLKYNNQNWFEKPPLYFWLAMLPVKIFGQKEFAYRLPSAILAIANIVLLYLISKRLSNKRLLSFICGLLLIFSPFYFILARQTRLDIAVLSTILLAFYLFIIAQQKEKIYLFIGPVIGLALMFKSIIGLLAIPLILVFSLIYRKWSFLKNKYFWLGFGLSLIIILPWHIYEYKLWGLKFWQDYLGTHVLYRAKEGFGNESGNYLAYFKPLWNFYQPWWQLFIVTGLTTLLLIKKSSIDADLKKLSQLSLTIVILIIFIFSLSKTHIPTYILPIYPFMLINIISIIGIFWQKDKKNINKTISFIIIVLLSSYSILLSTGKTGTLFEQLHLPFDKDLKEIGLIVREQSINETKLYLLNWPIGQTINYYSQREPLSINSAANEKIKIQGPFFLFMPDATLVDFFQKNGTIKPEYQNLKIKYSHNHLILLYNAEDIEIPVATK